MIKTMSEEEIDRCCVYVYLFCILNLKLDFVLEIVIRPNEIFLVFKFYL